MPARDQQVGGNHYAKHKIQPWDVIAEYNLDFWLGNVVKYVLRHQDKGGVEDLEKALHYLRYAIERRLDEPKLPEPWQHGMSSLTLDAILNMREAQLRAASNLVRPAEETK